MPRITLTDTERQALAEALADAEDLRTQTREAVEAGLQPQSDLERLDGQIQQIESTLRIYG